MTDTNVAVTGLGLVTPGGVGVEASWASALKGSPAAARDPELTGTPVALSCRVPGFDPEALLGARRALRLDRFTQMALVAAREAVADAGLDQSAWDEDRVGVVIGTATGGTQTFEDGHGVLLGHGPSRVSPLVLPMYLPNMVAGQIALEFGVRGPNLVVVTACASGASAIGAARDLLNSRRCDLVLAGGTEAALNPVIMTGFARMGALSANPDPATASRPFDADRDGFVGGEGAGILVLQRAADARADGRRIRGHVVGYGASADAYHITKPEPSGRGVAAAIHAALSDAGAAAADVGHVNAHGTSTVLNDRVEAEVLARLLPDGPLVTSTKGVTGHMMGAGGAVEAAFTVLALETGIVPPTANLMNLDPEIDIEVATAPTPVETGLALSNSFGFGGQNAVLAIAPA